MTLRHPDHGELVGYEHGAVVFQRPSGVIHKVRATEILPPSLSTAAQLYERVVQAGRTARVEHTLVQAQAQMFGQPIYVGPLPREAPHG